MDRGNENIYCEGLQVFFTGNPESFIYGASIHNQRIESFWARLKRFKTSWWIEYFKENVETQQEALIFCFLPVLQSEFNIFVKTWNSRMIRQSVNTPGGRPDMLFYVPSIAGFTYAGVKIDGEKIAIAQDLLGTEHCPVYQNRDLNDSFICNCEIHNLNIPQVAESALEL